MANKIPSNIFFVSMCCGYVMLNLAPVPEAAQLWPPSISDAKHPPDCNYGLLLQLLFNC